MAESIQDEVAPETATRFAARCLASGDPRVEVAEALQNFFGVSRATAYRTIARVLIDSDDSEPIAIVRDETGTIDLRAEAERQYSAAVAQCDSKAALRWFAVLQRLSS